MTPLKLVREFHKKFDLHVAAGPELPTAEERAGRWALLAEEFGEWGEAEADDDLVKIADAFADMVYVIYGTALRYGIPLDAVLAEVHRSNMTKELVDDGDPMKPVRKGVSYEPPRIKEILVRAAREANGR